jgi:hypothetical protein
LAGDFLACAVQHEGQAVDPAQQAKPRKGAFWKIAADCGAAHSFLDTCGSATRDVIVNF